mgnify:CR=1 FL=1
MKDMKVGFIGFGNMAQALARGFVRTGALSPDRIGACARDAAKLRRFISERSKILPRRTTGTCAMHQRQLTEAIKRARQIALLPFVTE